MKKLTILCLVALTVIAFATTASAKAIGDIGWSTDTAIVE